MSFATRLSRALGEANRAISDALSDALTTFQTSLDAELVTYGAPGSVRAMADDRILEVAVVLSDQMAGTTPDVSGAIMTENDTVLLTETGTALRTEQ